MIVSHTLLRRLSPVRILAVLFILCLISPVVFAATYYVDPQTGSINNPGNESSPWSTLQEVFTSGKITSVVRPGDTLLLRTGHHGTVSRSGMRNSDYITIKAQDGQKPTLSRIALLGCEKWRIEGLTISPEFTPPIGSGYVVRLSSASENSRDMVINNCTIYTVADASGWTASDWATIPNTGIHASFGTHMTVTNNDIRNVYYGMVVGGTDLTLSGNTINGFVDDGINTGGTYITIENNTIKNLYDVTEAHNDGIQVYSGGTDAHDHIIMRNNTIIQFDPWRTDNLWGGLQGLGCFDGPNTNWIVENNIVSVDHYHGITIFAARNVNVINNTILDPIPNNATTPAISLQDVVDRGGVCENSIVRNNLSPRYNSTTSNPTIIQDHNITYSNPGDHFVNVAQNDFRLKEGSTAINAGSATLAPTVDRAGTPRPQDGLIDVGAYEYIAGAIGPQPEPEPEPDPEPQPEPEPATGVLVVDHRAVDEFDSIPDAWIDAAKKQIVHYVGASHGRQLPYGLEMLADMDPKYSVQQSENLADLTDTGSLRVLRAQRSPYSDWIGSISDEKYWATPDGKTWTTRTMQYALTENKPITVSLWCWSWHLVFDWTEDENGVIGTFDDVRRDNYFDALRMFNDDPSMSATKFIYSTVVTDANVDANGWRTTRYNADFRTRVPAGGVLFDQADIENWNYANSAQRIDTWDGNTLYLRHPDYAEGLTPDNNPEADHANDLIGLRKAKAFWWMLARMAGWDGTSTVPPVVEVTPVIQTTTITPNSGIAGVGDTITITATEAHGLDGLSQSSAVINTKTISLAGIGGGVYSGDYTIADGDASGTGIEATNVVLGGPDGTSAPVSSTGSTLTIDAVRPAITSVVLAPNSGTVKPGDTIDIIVNAANNETALTPSNARFLGSQVPLSDRGNGLYQGTYMIQTSDQAAKAASDVLFSDDFESGDTSAWSSTSTSFAIGSDPLMGGNSLEYDVRTTALVRLTKDFTTDLPETHTSFSFMIDANYTMAEGDRHYITSMQTQAGQYSWYLYLRRANGAFEMLLVQNGGRSVGSWTPILPGQAHQIMVHIRSGATGHIEWWLDGQSVSAYSGDLGSSTSGKLNAVFMSLVDAGTSGKLHWDNVQVTTGEATTTVSPEATSITLTDAAGNISNMAASIGSTLSIAPADGTGTDTEEPAQPPVIASVAVTPNSGVLKVGDSATVTVTAQNDESGLLASAATFNGVKVPLVDGGTGTYSGTYTVAEGHADAVNAEATAITLTSPGGTSTPASSTGSTLMIDANTPAVASVEITPDSGWLKPGDTVTVTVTATDAESGLSSSPATINGRKLDVGDAGNGQYTAVYTVEANDPELYPLEVTGISLADAAGNTSPVFTPTGSSLGIDLTAPAIASVTLNPADGTVGPGDKVEIIVTAEGNETDLVASDARFLGRTVPLEALSAGTFSGSYTIQDGDAAASVSAVSIFTDGFEDRTIANWTSGSSTLQIGTDSANGSASVMYDVTSTALTTLQQDLGQNYPDTYTSFSFKLDPGFTMNSGSRHYITAMRDTSNRTTWSVYLTRSGEDYQIALVRYPGSTVGSWVTIRKGVWNHIKVHYQSASEGTVEWWLNSVSQASYSGNTSGSSSGILNGVFMSLVDRGTTGRQYWDTFVVTTSDNDVIVHAEATDITLADMAGNISDVASSSGSKLVISDEPAFTVPKIASVTLTPQSGIVKVGGQVLITVASEGLESGLAASDAMFNGVPVTLTDSGDGTYAGTYVVMEGHADAVNAEATAITLTGRGGTSEPASSSGSTLTVDANTPSVASVTLAPDAGWLALGDTVVVTVTAANAEMGLTPSLAVVNTVSVPFTARGDGTYTGTYTVREDAAASVGIVVEGIRLTDAAGNTSPEAQSVQGPGIDLVAPAITSVTMNPSTGTVRPGDSIEILVTAEGGESGLIPSDAEFLQRRIPLASREDGTYAGTYTVETGDIARTAPADAIYNDDFENGGLSSWTSVSAMLDVADESRFGAHSVGYDVTSTVSKTLVKELGREYDETYTSFYFKMDPEFTMNDGARHYITAMRDYSNNTTWRIYLTRAGDDYQIALIRNPGNTVGNWVTIKKGQWNWIKVHYRSNTDGIIEWWLNDVSQSSYSGDTSASTAGKLYGVFMSLVDAGTRGKLYWDSFIVSPTDHGEASPVAASKITLTDAAGNVSAPASSDVAMLTFDTVAVARIAIAAPLAPITDMALVRTSETFAILGWSPPAIEGIASYIVEAAYTAPAGTEWQPFRCEEIQPLAGTATVRFDGMRPGFPHFFRVRYKTADGRFSPLSNYFGTLTLAQFVDDDLDADDPYIVRDEDSLFVASNDATVSFSWSSWEELGASSYDVSLTDVDKNVEIQTVAVQDTVFSYTSERSGRVAITVTPKTSSGQSLGSFGSRAVSTTFDVPDVPEAPRIGGIE